MALGHFGNVKKSAIEPDVSIGTRVQISLHVLLPFVINSLGPRRSRDIEDEGFTFNHLDWTRDGGKLRLDCKQREIRDKLRNYS